MNQATNSQTIVKTRVNGTRQLQPSDEELKEALEYIAFQPCEVWGDSKHCLTNDTSITNRCWPCFARAILGMPGERG